MNCVMPFTKDIEFSTNIKEICSISLEHEFNVNNKVILGNFFISGTYKSHELSVNMEDFSYTLPFDVSLADNIKEDTVNFIIDNFTYEIVDNNTLKVDIDYLVKAEEKILIKEEKIFEEVPEDLSDIFASDAREVIKEDAPRELKKADEDTILSFASNNEESFVTYKVHIIKDGETIESIAKLYNKTENEVYDYNTTIKFLTGEKVLIPEDE